jgi:asparagine synthase (glutamine-hydrolysing)
MRYSLEVRSPFLDHRVVEFAASLPLHYRYEPNNKKKILKDILKDIVPVMDFNKPKSGFTMPFEIWFRTSLKDWVMDSLTPKNLKNIPYINIDKVITELNSHMSGDSNRYNMIWKLLVYTNWLSTAEK